MPDQYKIPQNIDVEDKILGPFTLKQFLYIMGGGIIIYVLFNIFAKTNLILFLVISIPIAIAVLMLVFVKVNERPFLDFFFYFIAYLQDPKEKKWIKSTKVKEFKITAKISEAEEAKQKEIADLSRRGIVRSQLQQMAIVLDSRGWSRESLDQELKGRVASSVEEKSVVRQKFAEEENLADMFSDIEGAVTTLKSGVQEESASNLAERLKILLE
ncbi:MAG: PrgI family protein [Patescibacteria group bacterium]|nr:PrgI family protein [Patescibacteria group bacterium]